MFDEWENVKLTGEGFQEFSDVIWSASEYRKLSISYNFPLINHSRRTVFPASLEGKDATDVGAPIQSSGRKVSHLPWPSPSAAGSEDTTRNRQIGSAASATGAQTPPLRPRDVRAAVAVSDAPAGPGEGETDGLQGCAPGLCRENRALTARHGQPVPPASQKQLMRIRAKILKSTRSAGTAGKTHHWNRLSRKGWKV